MDAGFNGVVLTSHKRHSRAFKTVTEGESIMQEVLITVITHDIMVVFAIITIQSLFYSMETKEETSTTYTSKKYILETVISYNLMNLKKNS
jgi:hypothetical protein